MFETALVIGIVVLAALFIVRRFVRRIGPAGANAHGCGQPGCPHGGSCGGQHHQG